MARDTHRVMKHEDGWQVKRDGGKRASHVTENKAEAMKLGRAISKNQGTEFVEHNADGKIANADSHGRDPKSSKG